jgi:hypothetical protein
MKQVVLITLIYVALTLCGCSTEKAPEPAPKIPAIALSLADKEKLLAFQKDLLNIEGIADKAVKLAGDELKKAIKGEEVSISLSSITDRAKAECLLAGETLAKKSVPDTLPPEIKKLLNDSKADLAASYKAYAESFDAIRGFVTDKNPMALLEYRKKSSEARKLFTDATDTVKKVMTAAGASQ